MEENVSYPEDFNFGYDPTQIEKLTITTLPVTALPTSYVVNSAYLPPVGSQGRCPSCVAWGSIYGMVSYWSACNNGTDPSQTDGQASPAFIYIKVMQSRNEPSDQCDGSLISQYLPILQQDGGTPGMDSAPYTNGSPMGSGECNYLWQQYASGTPAINASFNIPATTTISTKDRNQVKQALANGQVVAYGTKLYTDFGPYRGNPVPYVGNGVIQNNKQGKPAGHCMLVIGYDDNCNHTGVGAFLIQNSWGTGWGSNGQVWMAYDTFEALVQGQGVFVPNNS